MHHYIGEADHDHWVGVREIRLTYAFWLLWSSPWHSSELCCWGHVQLGKWAWHLQNPPQSTLPCLLLYTFSASALGGCWWRLFRPLQWHAVSRLPHWLPCSSQCQKNFCTNRTVCVLVWLYVCWDVLWLGFSLQLYAWSTKCADFFWKAISFYKINPNVSGKETCSATVSHRQYVLCFSSQSYPHHLLAFNCTDVGSATCYNGGGIRCKR